MADNPAKPDNKQVMDVSRPGHTTPSPSSRPVLLNHKPVLQDPMFNSAKTEDDKSKPGSDPDQSTSDDKITTGVAQTIQPPKQELDPDTASNQTTHQPQAVPQSTDSIPEHQLANDYPPAQNKPQADIGQLVHDKTYFMPITQPPRRYGLPWILLAVAGLIIAGVAYLLLMTPS